jgi:hypothetical protein
MLFGKVVTPVTMMVRGFTVMVSRGLMMGRGVEMVLTRWMSRRCCHCHPLFLEISSAASDEERTKSAASRNDNLLRSFRSRNAKMLFAYR